MDFDRIYTEYFENVYRFLLCLSGDEHTAEELTAETFFKALRSIGKFRGECDISTWLITIAKNCYYSHVKKKRHLSLNESNLYSRTDIPLHEKIADKETAAQIRTLISSLPNPYKDVFLWRVCAELSFKQIGAIFGKSDNWACVTYHRARKMILKQMEEYDDNK